MLHLTFIRHGQARHNVDAEMRGEHAYFDPINTDAELTYVGHVQTRAAQAMFPVSATFDAIYCSPSLRCRQTLMNAAGHHADAQIVYLDDRLMEPQGDAFCNKRMAREDLIASTMIPAHWDLSGVSDTNPFDVLKEGYTSAGAGYSQFASRIADFTAYIQSRHQPGDHILIVSHHDWIRTWFQVHLQRTVSPKNAEVLTAELVAAVAVAVPTPAKS